MTPRTIKISKSAQYLTILKYWTVYVIQPGDSLVHLTWKDVPIVRSKELHSAF